MGDRGRNESFVKEKWTEKWFGEVYLLPNLKVIKKATFYNIIEITQMDKISFSFLILLY